LVLAGPAEKELRQTRFNVGWSPLRLLRLRLAWEGRLQFDFPHLVCLDRQKDFAHENPAVNLQMAGEFFELFLPDRMQIDGTWS